MASRTLSVEVERLRLAAPFRISGYVFDHSDVVVATVREGPHCGRGEASGVYYLGDDADRMLREIEAARSAIESGIDRAALQALMPAGGARNALDCALWELESVRSGRPVRELAGLPQWRPLLTTFTLSADTPADVAARARDAFAEARAIKLKLTGEIDDDLDRVAAVREARDDVWLGVDANQGYARNDLELLLEALVVHRVALVEQPIRRGRETELAGLRSPIPIAADESVLTSADLRGLIGLFDVVNIKLDKCGGLTEALRMAAAARQLGLGVMVGNMIGTSLAIAPAFVLGQLCDIVDLDGPVFLADDRSPGVRYEDGFVSCGDDVWGAAAGRRAA